MVNQTTLRHAETSVAGSTEQDLISVLAPAARSQIPNRCIVPAGADVAIDHSATRLEKAAHTVTEVLLLPDARKFDWRSARVAFVDVSWSPLSKK